MKIAILGAGDISHALIQALPQRADVQITAVYHRQLHKALAFAARYKIPQAFDNLGKLLSSDADCIYIGLPNSLHYDVAMQCIAAHKHILIEKPVASNSAQVEKIFDFAKEQHVYALEVNRVVFLENFRFIQQMLPALGKRTLMDIHYCKRSRRYDDYLAGNRPNVFTLDFSGGALYDLGVYGIHFVCGLLGAPDSIEYRCVKLESGVDAMGIMTLTYPGCIASIHVSKISGGPTSSVRIEGESGSIISEFPPSELKTVAFSRTHASGSVQLQEGDGFSAFLKNALRIIHARDDDACQRLCQQSLMVARLMEQARAQCGIVFAEDEK